MIGIRDILKLDQWPDLAVGENGYAAKRRVDVAPFAYEINVNKPLGEDMIQRMVSYAGEADSRLTKELFQMCNGLRIGATKFAVYGVIGQIDRGNSDVAYHPPLNINVPNIYGRPKGWPENYLIVGTSTEDDESGQDRKLFHAITPDARIVIAAKDEPNTAIREYPDVEAWLSGEVERAIRDTARY